MKLPKPAIHQPIRTCMMVYFQIKFMTFIQGTFKCLLCCRSRVSVMQSLSRTLRSAATPKILRYCIIIIIFIICTMHFTLSARPCLGPIIYTFWELRERRTWHYECSFCCLKACIHNASPSLLVQCRLWMCSLQCCKSCRHTHRPHWHCTVMHTLGVINKHTIPLHCWYLYAFLL